MIESIKKFLNENKSFVKYLLISGFVTLLDIIVSWSSEFIIPLIYANSVGIMTGFIVQYFMTAKMVYNKNGVNVFFKFFLTFILGFIMANGIVYFCRVLIFDNSKSLIAFIVSKGFSIVIPFFVMYFIRKRWIGENE